MAIRAIPCPFVSVFAPPWRKSIADLLQISFAINPLICQSVPAMKRIHDTLPIYQRGKSLLLVKSFKGEGQKQINLDTDKKNIAEARTKRFLATFEINGFQTAMEELKGGKVIKKGDDLDFERIKKAFGEFCEQAEQPPRENTAKGYLAALKRIMGNSTLSKLDVEKWKKEYLNQSDDPSRRRSLVSELRNAKAIFCKAAMRFYSSKGYTVVNPFENTEMSAPKIMQYTPLPEKTRVGIWDDIDNQPPDIAIMVLLALACGFRSSEIEHCHTSWFSEQVDSVIVSIKEEIGYIPKSGEKRTFKISNDLYKRLLNHRAKIITDNPKLADDVYFIPVVRRKQKGLRLDKRNRACAKYLRSMGIVKRLPLHTLRAEAGSIHLMQNNNILETSRFLGHSDVTVTQRHYLGILNQSVVVGLDDKPAPIDPLEETAKIAGITLEELKKTLGIA